MYFPLFLTRGLKHKFLKNTLRLVTFKLSQTCQKDVEK